MHELGITRNIVAIVSEHANGRRVRSVTVDIGKLSAIVPDAIRFCFDVCAKDTPLDGATLHINEIEGVGRCDECGREVALQQRFGACTCGCRAVTCIAGDEMTIREMEVV